MCSEKGALKWGVYTLQNKQAQQTQGYQTSLNQVDYNLTLNSAGEFYIFGAREVTCVKPTSLPDVIAMFLE